MLIRMVLARIVIVDSDEDKMSMIVLREINGERAFPILIHDPEVGERMRDRLSLRGNPIRV